MGEELAAQAILTSLDFRSAPESRLAASSFLDSLKSGDIAVLCPTAMDLAREKRWCEEVRLYGFKMLQHAVRMRWEELTADQRAQFADMVLALISAIAASKETYALRSQTAALVVEVVRREGASLWQEMLPKLFELSSQSTSHVELVVMVLRMLPEDVTVHNEDLEGDRRRALVIVLTQSLPQILPFFFKILHLNFGEAINFLQQNDLEPAREHAAIVNATLAALLAYAEWVPVTDLATSGLIDACGFFLNGTVDFKLTACDFFKQLASRRRPLDESAAPFDSAMSHVSEIILEATQSSLSVNSGVGTDLLECLCETMVSLGLKNLQCFAKERIAIYLQQMLIFLKHESASIHFRSLLLWLTVVRDAPSSLHEAASQASSCSSEIPAQVGQEKNALFHALSDEVYAVLLDVAYDWMLKKSLSKGASSDGSLCIEDDLSSSGDYTNHRGRLLELVRLVTARRPLLSLSKISQKIGEICATAVVQPSDVPYLECMQRLLDNTLHAVFERTMLSEVSDLQSELIPHLEGILNALLVTSWTELVLIEVHGRLLDALGPFLRISPSSALQTVNKIFQLLSCLPVIPKGSAQDTVVVAFSRGRLQVCASFLRIAKAADRALAHHMEIILENVGKLQQQGLLSQGEQNLMAEACLIISSSGGNQRLAEVLEWILKPLKEKWADERWQEQYLAQPSGLVELLTRKPEEAKQNEEMWSIFHTLTLFERVLKRCTTLTLIQIQKVVSSTGSTENPTSLHPMVNHQQWMIPPLLKLLRCVHALWCPSIRHSLPHEVQEALVISQPEQASLIGEAGSKASKENASVSSLDATSGGLYTYGGRENAIRNWLKGVRESGYNIIGLCALHLNDRFYFYNDCSDLATALLENIKIMEFRHIRQLLHSAFIPVIKACPYSYQRLWVRALLPQLLSHCEKILSVSWSTLKTEGTLKGLGISGLSDDIGLKNEVMEEKLLRDLTRETCSLLALLASSPLNASLPSGEQLSQPWDQSALEKYLQSKTDCVMSLLMEYREIAFAALSIAKQALSWPDSDTVHKVLSFCNGVVAEAAFSTNAELQNFVAKDMFTAIIEALTVDSNASVHTDLVNLFRIIYLQFRYRNEAPSQILRSLPSVSAQSFDDFENAMRNTSSTKEQKQFIKQLLLVAGGNQLKALLPQRANVITNLSNRGTDGPRVNPTQIEESGSIGLAAIL